MNNDPHKLLTYMRRLASLESVRFFVLGAVLALLLSPGNLSFDSERRLQVTRWIWTDEPQVRNDDTFYLNSLPGRNGKPMAQFGVGQSMVMLPADMISYVIFGRDLSPRDKKLREMLVYYLTFPLISGLVLFYARRICGLFLDNAHHADFATLAFAFCTSYLVYSRDSQENMLMNLCVLGGVWHGLRWIRGVLLRDAIGMAALFGYLLLIRVSTIAVIAPFTVVIVLGSISRHWSIDRKKLLLGISLIAAILVAFVAIDRLYHWHRFGEFTKTYADYMVEKAKLNGRTDNFPMGNRFWDGIRSYAFDTRKAFYLFDPVVFISAIGLCLPLKSRHATVLKVAIISSFSAIFLTACLYAKSHFWHGDSSWGPRHLNVAVVPTVLFGIITILHYLAKQPTPILRVAFSSMLIAGFVVQMLSLPLYNDLEVDQAKAGYPVTFPPALRVMNLAATMKGEPALWGLDCGSAGIQKLQGLPLQFAPFQIAHKMPDSPIGSILIAIWCVALLAFFAVLGVWLSRIMGKGQRSVG